MPDVTAFSLNLTINNQVNTTVNASICQGQSYYAGGAWQTVSGTYRDTLITSGGCDSIVTTFLIVKPAPKPNLGPDFRLCTGDSKTITPGLFSAYLWQDNSTLPTLSVNSVGQYWVTVTDTVNCKATDTLDVLVIDTLPHNFLPADQPLCYGNTLKLSISGYQSYLWSTGSVSNQITIFNAGTYYLIVTDSHNCKGTDTLNLVRKNCIPILIPNAFTPNRDGRNDIFKPTINQDIVNYSMVVYNRFGQKIFESHDYGKGWDGTLKGKDQPLSTYAYRITFTNIFGYTYDERGTVILIR